MPEMPEVETIARQLRTVIAGRDIAEVRLSGLPLRRPIAHDFAEMLCNRTITGVQRFGKYLVLELHPKAFWLIHLGMSGRILYHGSGGIRQSKHTHAIVWFSDGSGLEYRDPRRFGLLAAYEGMPLSRIPEIQSLGKDPLSRSFTAEWLEKMLRGSNRDIKAFLLDQHRIAGLGNIYVCEALFGAGIHPTRRCPTVTPAESRRLTQAIRRVLSAAVRHKGTTFSDFRGADGATGHHQDCLKVFQRQGEACFHCRRPIQKITQGNRSSFFCPHCQC